MMEHNEMQDFEQIEEYGDEIGYEEDPETIDNLVEERYDERLHEELAEKNFDEFVLEEVIDQTEIAQPEYLDCVENNPYEDRTSEYANREMVEATQIEIAEDLGIEEGITEIDTEDAEHRMLEQSLADFGKNKNNYQRIKEFDAPSGKTVPRYKKMYSGDKSQKQIMSGNWTGREYQTQNSYRRSG